MNQVLIHRAPLLGRMPCNGALHASLYRHMAAVCSDETQPQTSC